MPISNHPDDERLAALAGHDADAIADPELSSHVTSCDRCAALVDELGALRAALADLPDLAPSRPVRLLPSLEAEPAPASDRLGGWARRFFAPVLASGAALALVGAIGTAGPAFMAQQASGPAAASIAAGGADAAQEFAAEPTESTRPLEAPAAAASEEGATRESTDSALAPFTAGEGAAATAEAAPTQAAPADEATASDGSTLSVEDDDRAASGAPTTDQVSVERSPWPMVLFAGVALMVAAVLLRWILAPRAA